VHWLDVLALFGLGLFAGGYGTMVGLGGGFLIVPAFLLMHFDARSAAGTSMLVVLANSASGTISYWRQRRVDFRTALLFAVAGVPGVWLGAALDQVIPQRLFTGAFALLLLWVAWRMITAKAASAELQDEAVRDDEPRPGLVTPLRLGEISRDFVDAQGMRHVYRFNAAAGVAISVAAGIVASAFGLGGGLIYMPAMVTMFGFPVHVATATSQSIIAITSCFGTASHAIYGDVRWTVGAIVAAGAIVGAQAGARIAKHVAALPLMRLLALGALLMAAKLAWDVIR
jgi:uncharacterized membrane protein YfcA